MIDLTATYTTDYARVIVCYMSDDSVEFTVMGEVSNEAIAQVVNAGGADVAGWDVDLD